MFSEVNNYIDYGLARFSREGKKIIKRKDYLIYEEAQNIIDKAKQDAEQIIKKAEETFIEEFEGKREALESYLEKEKLKKMYFLTKASISYLSVFENSLVDLLINLLKKIISEIPDKKIILELVRKGVSIQKAQQKISIRVAQEGKKFVEEEIKQITKDFNGINLIDVVADKNVKKGECIIESKMGTVRTSIEEQIRILKEEIYQKVYNR